MDLLKPWQQNVVDNLRRLIPEIPAHITDRTLLDLFTDYSDLDGEVMLEAVEYACHDPIHLAA